MKGSSEYERFNLKSVSKSLLSALTGIALHEKHLKSVDQKMMDFFPEYATENLDPQMYHITIRHLLTMRSGFDIKENVNDRYVWKSSDWIKAIMQVPINWKPGKKFNYTTFNTHLLSAIISKASGMSTMEYADKTLFSPLGISHVGWRKDPQGYHFGGSEMYLTARDMAKFGQLYLNSGNYNGKQVVPSQWVKQSTSETSGLIRTYFLLWKNSYGYGYLWWIKRLAGYQDLPFASGYGGQKIVVIPQAKVVIVITASTKVDPAASHKRHKMINKFLFDDLAMYFLKK
jgi:CubicO group peptidase (beta-lactamase class C family)